MGMKKILVFLFVVLAALGYWVYAKSKTEQKSIQQVVRDAVQTVVATPTVVLPAVPSSHFLSSNYQIFQTWNNCGPASLSMALYYFGIHKTQAELGYDIRPYQNATGDNDDKSSSLDELALEAEKFGLSAYVRPNGNMQTMKQFVAQGLPVVVETTLTTTDDIGHYRVVKGYDDSNKTILEDDSFQGHNVTYSYTDLHTMWKMYDNQYLVLFPKDKKPLVDAILGKDLDLKTAWKEAADVNRQALAVNPNDVYARFNLSVALYYIGDYQGSVSQFEQVQSKLPFRTLWYQIEPIQAYYQLGNYAKVFAITDNILNNGNRAFSELYIIRGDIYKKQGNIALAKAEYEKAVQYNSNMQAAKDALKSVE